MERNTDISCATMQYIEIVEETARLKEQYADLAKDDKYIDADNMGIVIGNFCATIESLADTLSIRICGRITDRECFI